MKGADPTALQKKQHKWHEEADPTEALSLHHLSLFAGFISSAALNAVTMEMHSSSGIDPMLCFATTSQPSLCPAYACSLPHVSSPDPKDGSDRTWGQICPIFPASWPQRWDKGAHSAHNNTPSLTSSAGAASLSADGWGHRGSPSRLMTSSIGCATGRILDGEEDSQPQLSVFHPDHYIRLLWCCLLPWTVGSHCPILTAECRTV